jgi:hypothetical protein
VINWLGQRLAEYPEGSPQRVAALLDITQLENNKVAGVLQGALANAKLVKELAAAGHQVCARGASMVCIHALASGAPSACFMCASVLAAVHTCSRMRSCIAMRMFECHLPHVTPVCDALVLLTPAAAGQRQPGAAEPLAVQGRH